MNMSVSNDMPLSYAYQAMPEIGRVSVPVSRAQLLYANFEHVSGVEARDGASYSIDKLQILNTIIDRLSSIRSAVASDSVSGKNDARLDALIERYGKELHAAVTAKGLPYARPQGVVPGMLVSLAA